MTHLAVPRKENPFISLIFSAEKDAVEGGFGEFWFSLILKNLKRYWTFQLGFRKWFTIIKGYLSKVSKISFFTTIAEHLIFTDIRPLRKIEVILYWQQYQFPNEFGFCF